jgi:hypothetical protein
MCTLLNHGATGVVVEAELVLGILCHMCPLSIELLKGEVTSYLLALMPLGLLLIPDWE